MRISDWSSDVCSSDLEEPSTLPGLRFALPPASPGELSDVQWDWTCDPSVLAVTALPARKGFDMRDLRLFGPPRRASDPVAIGRATCRKRVHCVYISVFVVSL